MTAREELGLALWRTQTLRGLADCTSPQTRDRFVGELLAAGWRPPLPDSDTEWGCRDRHGRVHSVGVETEAQARAMRSMTPVRREVGPWTEVQPQ